VLTYRKTRKGDWVAFGPASEISVGAITVAKRSGAVEQRFCTGTGASFDVDGIPHRYGYLAERSNGYRNPVVRRGGCRGCGGPIRDASHHRAMEGYCGSCAFDEFDC
jgi:hypothetical protein